MIDNSYLWVYILFFPSDFEARVQRRNRKITNTWIVYHLLPIFISTGSKMWIKLLSVIYKLYASILKLYCLMPWMNMPILMKMQNFVGQNSSWRTFAECWCKSGQCFRDFANFYGSPLWTNGAYWKPEDQSFSSSHSGTESLCPGFPHQWTGLQQECGEVSIWPDFSSNSFLFWICLTPK